MSERPDLDRLREDLGFPPKLIARTISGYWRQKLLDTIDYAAALERELAAAQEETQALAAAALAAEWDLETDPPQCGWCLGTQDALGHEDDCKIKALAALALRVAS